MVLVCIYVLMLLLVNLACNFPHVYLVASYVPIDAMKPKEKHHHMYYPAIAFLFELVEQVVRIQVMVMTVYIEVVVHEGQVVVLDWAWDNNIRSRIRVLVFDLRYHSDLFHDIHMEDKHQSSLV